MQPIKLACIGCGFIARRHLDNIAEMDHVSVETLVDRRPEAASAFQQEYGIKNATNDVDQAFGDPDIDAVMICTHHDSHTPLSIAAAGQNSPAVSGDIPGFKIGTLWHRTLHSTHIENLGSASSGY